MSDIIIREDGTPKQLNPTRLATKSDNSTVNWIPEQIATLARITINSNGEYLASNDGYYGYAIVNVCVAGGNEAEISGDPYVDPVTDPQTGEEVTPDHEVEDFTGDFLDPELEPPTKVTPPPNSKAGTQSGKVMGIDPDTGEYVQVSVDENGDLVYEAAKFPTKIRILTPPAKLEYAEGEKINYAGLKVSLLTEDDEVFVNDDFPWGFVPWQPVPNALFEGDNLITPEEYVVAGSSSVNPSASSSEYGNYVEQPVEYIRAPTGLYSVINDDGSAGTSVKLVVREGHPYLLTRRFEQGSTSLAPIFVSDEPFVVEYYSDYTPQSVISGFDRYADTLGSSKYTAQDGKSCYHAHDNYFTRAWSALPVEPIRQTASSSTYGFYTDLAMLIIHGDSVGGGRMEVPVKWKSPYDGNTYETSFEITVTE